ncbi:class I SAM-dependent methyltransferase [Chitinibacter bivalviorum]|uniref:Class I SAM-dependent methyltransferase n=1 Tax=Chitinibacter bivalviorum TaxID=2739434 RepID=A0A7H9BE30_9NEIS|nr:class I SAM-dependent methyltransferase [Chitinibacter bivalviorum]QLG86980.1 class I SAM-dependent methyltransferase [Chitinibacter bivalviorum]
MNSAHYFSQAAQSWDQDPMKLARADAVASAIAQAVPLQTQMAAMEFGCGTGLLSFALAKQLGSILLVDNSSGMLAVLEEKIAAQQIKHMQFAERDLTQEDLPERQFDLIYSMMTFHHIADTAQILSTLTGLLSQPGFLCIADLDAEDGSFHGADFDGHKGFDRDGLRKLAERAGLSNIRFETVFTIHKNKDMGQGEFPVFLMVAEKD